jgi:hypothetical protein
MTLNINTFDTLHHTKRAIKAGFTPEQAEELVSIIHDTLVTKTDLAFEMAAFEDRMKSFQLKMLTSILAGVPSIITILQFVLPYLHH